MGANAALLTRKVIDNTFEVLAVELLAILQAVDYLKICDKLSTATKAAYFELRAIVPIFEEDSVISTSLHTLRDFIRNEEREYVSRTIQA